MVKKVILLLDIRTIKQGVQSDQGVTKLGENTDLLYYPLFFEIFYLLDRVPQFFK